MHKPVAVFFFVLLLVASVMASADRSEDLDIARFDESGNLVVPDDLDQWIFVGSSLGMGYSQADFDPDSPGMFQIVRMEPNAYRAFKETGAFIDGTMLSLHFYGSQNEISINRAGFVMSDLHFAEIHYKHSTRFPDGFNFYNLNNGETIAEEIALPNDCVDCHKKDGAYDGVFVQFYPALQPYLPADVAKRVKSSPAHGGHDRPDGP